MKGLSESELFRATLDCLPLGVYILDRERRVRFWNRAAEQVTGFLAQDIVGQTCSGPLEHCDQQGHVLCGERCPALTAMRTGEPQQAHVFSLHKQGHRVAVRVRTIPLFQGEELPVGVVVAFEEGLNWTRPEDTTPQMNGCHDPATGIPSQRLTRAVVNECLAALEQSHAGFGLLRISVEGLDRFRSKHGPQSVVPFLRTAAQTLPHALEPDSFLGRWGTDEFLAVVQTASPVKVAATAETMWNLIRQSEVSWWGDRLPLAAGVSYTIARAGDQLEALLDKMKIVHKIQSSAASKGQ
jgi:PAS domain S-box-containing protein